jgi:hypothetical protein
VLHIFTPSELTAQTGDDRYWKALLYLFELQIPGRKPVFRALLLGPTSYSYRANFASDKRVAQLGAVHVYEQGIVMAQIDLAIDPGARLARKLHDGVNLTVLSGHGRMLQIWDDIIRPYSDAKKDPNLAAGTQLWLHVQKDRKRFRVVPDVWSFQRIAGRPAQSPYTVSMTAVGEGSYYDVQPKAVDKSWFDRIRDGNRALRESVQAATAAVQQITAEIGAARLIAQELTGVIGDVQVLLDACNTALEAGSDLVRYPLQAVRNLLVEVEHATQICFEQSQAIPAGFADDWARLGDALDRVAANAEVFATPLAATLNALEAQRGSTTAGFATQANGIRLGQSYVGWSDVVVQASDTPAGFEARYGRAWAEIAAANRLRPPYLTPVQLPGCLAPGQRILVPIPPGGAPQMNSHTPGVQVGESGQADVFGRDWRFDDVEGWALNSQGTDLDLVEGVPNVVQQLGYKLDTVRGTNVIYPDLGRVGDVGNAVSLEEVALQEAFCRVALAQDPRVKEIRDVTVALEGDTLATELSVFLTDSSIVRALGQLER